MFRPEILDDAISEFQGEMKRRKLVVAEVSFEIGPIFLDPMVATHRGRALLQPVGWHFSENGKEKYLPRGDYVRSLPLRSLARTQEVDSWYNHPKVSWFLNDGDRKVFLYSSAAGVLATKDVSGVLYERLNALQEANPEVVAPLVGNMLSRLIENPGSYCWSAVRRLQGWEQNGNLLVLSQLLAGGELPRGRSPAGLTYACAAVRAVCGLLQTAMLADHVAQHSQLPPPRLWEAWTRGATDGLSDRGTVLRNALQGVCRGDFSQLPATPVHTIAGDLCRELGLAPLPVQDKHRLVGDLERLEKEGFPEFGWDTLPSIEVAAAAIRPREAQFPVLEEHEEFCL